MKTLKRMNYKELSTTPYKIHKEFGFILEDLVTNTPNTERPRPAAAWRQSYDNVADIDFSALPLKDQHFIDSKEIRELIVNQILHRFFGKLSVGIAIFHANLTIITCQFVFRKQYVEAAETVYNSRMTPVNFSDSSATAATINT